MVHVGKYAKDPEGKDNPNIQSNSTKIRHSSAPKQGVMKVLKKPQITPPGKHSVPFFKATVAAFTGSKLIEIKSNLFSMEIFDGCFLVTAALPRSTPLSSRPPNYSHWSWHEGIVKTRTKAQRMYLICPHI